METTVDAAQVESPAEVWGLFRALFGQHRRRFLIAAAALDLHPAQAGALLQLASPLPMTELAALLACDNSNVTGLIDRLEARGLVTRQASSQDRRVKQVVLTAAGRRLRERMLARVGQPTRGFERLSPEQLHELGALLRQVIADDAAA